MSGDRPRLYIDENLPHQLAGALSKAFRRPIFRSHIEEHLTGVLDLPLFNELHLRRFDIIITKDLAQSHVIDERDGLRDAGLHWVGVREPKSARGLEFYSSVVSSIAASMPFVLERFQQPPHAFFVECESLKWNRPIHNEPL